MEVGLEVGLGNVGARVVGLAVVGATVGFGVGPGEGSGVGSGVVAFADSSRRWMNDSCEISSIEFSSGRSSSAAERMHTAMNNTRANKIVVIRNYFDGLEGPLRADC